MTLKALPVLLPLLLVFSPEANPCHFEFQLEVSAGKESKRVASDRPDLPGRLGERQVLSLIAGDEIQLSWSLKALEKNTATYKDLTIHAFVAREKELGQAKSPVQDESTIFESALFMDFPPRASASGDSRFQIDEPGFYLVRVETLGLADVEAHEHGAILDLKVVAAPGKPAAPPEAKPEAAPAGKGGKP